MDKITKLIRSEIKKQYKSVRQFSEKSSIPYSTISNALSRGVGGTSYQTVIKICNLLNLKHVCDADITVLNEQCYGILAMLSALDEQAIHTIKNVLKIEYERCTKENKTTQSHSELSIVTYNLDNGGNIGEVFL